MAPTPPTPGIEPGQPTAPSLRLAGLVGQEEDSSEGEGSAKEDASWGKKQNIKKLRMFGQWQTTKRKPRTLRLLSRSLPP